MEGEALCGAARAPGQGWALPRAGNVTLWASVSWLHQAGRGRGADLDQKIPRVHPVFCSASPVLGGLCALGQAV